MASISPITFAKGLSDPIQVNRLAALKSLTAWMDKSGSTYPFSRIEMEQFWRALQYTFWMSDKRPVQQQVAAECVLFVRRIDSKLFVEWNRAFWLNLDKMYESIDKHRIAKFHLLIRIYVAEMFHQLQTREWDLPTLTAVLEQISLNGALGAHMHVLSIFVEELLLTVDGSLSNIASKKAVEVLLRPAFTVVEKSALVPQCLLTKALVSVLSHDAVLAHSAHIRSTIRAKLQTAAKDTNIPQEARDALYSAVDKVDTFTQSNKAAGITETTTAAAVAETGQEEEVAVVKKKKVKRATTEEVVESKKEVKKMKVAKKIKQ